MEPNEPLGPPELPKKGAPAVKADAAPRLQLVTSTKTQAASFKAEADEDEDEPDELNEMVQHPGDPDGVHAAEQERIWRQTHEDPQFMPRSTAPKRRWPIVILMLALIAAAAAGAYWFGTHKAAAPATKGPDTQKAATNSDAQPTTTATKHYDSTTYTLGFDYPEDWSISDTAAKLTVTSPAMRLTSTDGSKHDTHVIVTIQNQQTTIPGYPSNGAIAALDSDHLTYKQPTAVQRAQTYLSYLSYQQQNGLDQLFITGDNGYQQGQNIPMSDIVKSNPLISVSFETCASVDCSAGNTAPATLRASDWKTAAANKQVADLLQSMQLN